MKKAEEDRLRTADLAHGKESQAPAHDERVVNRADERPATDRAESLWDKTVKHERPAGEGPVEHRPEHAQPATIDQPRAGSPVAESVPARASDVHLFRQEETSELSRRWSDIQASFVDEPRRAVELADSLVAETMQRLAQMFAGARENLEHQWDRGENVTTEDLRVTLQRYRSFFDRLLSV